MSVESSEEDGDVGVRSYCDPPVCPHGAKRSKHPEPGHPGSVEKEMRALLNSESGHLDDTSELVETWIIPDAKEHLSKSHWWRQEFKCAHPSAPNVSICLALCCKSGSGEAIQPLFEHSIAFKNGNESQRRCCTNITAELLREVGEDAVGDLPDKVCKDGVGDVQLANVSRKRKFAEISGENSNGSKGETSLFKTASATNDSDAIAIDLITFGPNELSSGKNVRCPAWPLLVLQSALHRDGSLHIRLALTIYDVDKAVRSRDLIRGLHRSGAFSDFTVEVENEHFAVHKCVLAAASREFEAIFAKKNCENVLVLTSISSPSGVKAFLALVYHDYYDWSCHSDLLPVILDVLKLTSRFRTKAAMDQLLAVISKAIDLDNVLQLLDAAIKCDASKAKELCFSFLLANRSRLQKSFRLTELLQNVPAQATFRLELAKIFFCRQICPQASKLHRSVDQKGRFPNEDALFSDLCVIQNADMQLKDTAGQFNSYDYKLGTSNSNWKDTYELKLYPKGRTVRLGVRGFASLQLSETRGLNFCWAYTDVCLEKPNGQLIFAVQNELVDFANSKVYTLDKAWAIGTLLGAVGEDKALRIRLSLRLVNRMHAVNCHCRVTDLCKSDAFFAQLRKKTMDLSYQSCEAEDKTVRAVETMIIKAAKQALPTAKAIYRHQFAFTDKKFQGVSFALSLESKGEAVDRFSLHHSAEFRRSRPRDLGRCWATTTVELLRMQAKQSILPYFTPQIHTQGKVVNVIDTLKLGPSEFTSSYSGSRSRSSECEAWPLTLLQSAINDDDEVHLRLTLELYCIGQAIKSRDFLRGLYHSGASADFTIVVGSVKLPCHKCVLAAASDSSWAKLAHLMRDKMLDLTPLSVKPESVRAFLSLIYSDVYAWRLDADVVSTIGDALKIADKFETKRVEEQLIAVMVEVICPDNLLAFFKLAISYGHEKLKELCLDFILRNRNAVQNSGCFAELLENSSSMDKARCEFLRMLFDRKLVWSSSCHCALSGCPNEFGLPEDKQYQYDDDDDDEEGDDDNDDDQEEEEASPLRTSNVEDTKLFANEHLKHCEVWLIEDAAAKLQDAALQYEFNYPANTSDKQNEHVKWKLELHPSGRNNQALYDRMASFSVSVGQSDVTGNAQRRGCRCLRYRRGCSCRFSQAEDHLAKFSCLAYVSASLEKSDGSAVFATDDDGQSNMLVEFTKSRGLTLDKAWPVATLQGAVNTENQLVVKVELQQIVNIRESLSCYELMRSVCKQRALADFAFAVDGVSFTVHKCILAQRSEIFAAMLSSEMRESKKNRLDLSHATNVDGLNAFVSSIYFAPSVKDGDEATTFELLKLAHQYGLVDVKSECDRQFARNIDMENVLEILSVCKLYGLSESNSACISYLRENCVEFLQSARWEALQKDEQRRELFHTLVRELLLEGRSKVL